MTTPFIFIGTHKIKPGKREAFKAYFATFCSEIVEPQEPRLHSFYGYTAPDSDVVTVVQVHPDADSMATHMKVGVEHFAEAYAEYLEPESTLQIYGTLTADLIGGDRRGPGVAVDLHLPPLGHEGVARRQLARLGEDGERRGDRVEGEEGLERRRVDLA